VLNIIRIRIVHVLVNTPVITGPVDRLLRLTYQQPAQNGALMDLFCRAIFCIHLSILPMQVATTISPIIGQ